MTFDQAQAVPDTAGDSTMRAYVVVSLLNLDAAGFPLELDVTDRHFRPTLPDVPRSSLSASSTTLGRAFVGGQSPVT